MVLFFLSVDNVVYGQKSPPEDVELIIQKVLNLSELRAYFSHLPRYRNQEETYYYLLANNKSDTSYDISIRDFRVAVLTEEMLAEKEINYYMVVKSLTISENQAGITIHYKSPRLAYNENKFVQVGVAFDKKPNNGWVATRTNIKELPIEKF